MSGQVDGLDLATDVVVVGRVEQVVNGGVEVVGGSKDGLSLVGPVWLVDILDCTGGAERMNKRNPNKSVPSNKDYPPVRIARGTSSRKSRRAILTPALRPPSLTVFSVTSRQIGMAQTSPLVKRTFSSTLWVELFRWKWVG